VVRAKPAGPFEGNDFPAAHGSAASDAGLKAVIVHTVQTTNRRTTRADCTIHCETEVVQVGLRLQAVAEPTRHARRAVRRGNHSLEGTPWFSPYTREPV